MDALVSAALDEIAAEGTQGCSLPNLWARLQGAVIAAEMHLDARAKQILWQQLLTVPGLLLLLPDLSASSSLDPSHPSVQSVEEAEMLRLRVLAPEGLRESSWGVYDLKVCDAHLSKDQRELLERLARARSQGITQSQLGKDFKMGGNKMFYVVRSLEARGLLVRQATIVRSKAPQTERGSQQPGKNAPIVATNLVHLTRYVKDLTLASHQRFEIPSSSKSNLPQTIGLASGDFTDGQEDIDKGREFLINDDFPAMGQVCERLEAADGRVLVVSDLKVSLGYRFALGHRNWRRLVKRLHDAGLVEVFNAQIDRKIVSCIRLLKSFDPKAFTSGNDETETETPLRGAKRGQVTEQVVEAPADHQIYDLIHSSGPEGLYMMELWKRLGLNNKRNYYRVTNMLTKGCVVSEAENHKRSMLYRLRTVLNSTIASNSKADVMYTKQETQTPQRDLPLVKPPLATAPPKLAKLGARRASQPRKAKEKGKVGLDTPTEGNELINPGVEEGQTLSESNLSGAMILFNESSAKMVEAEDLTRMEEVSTSVAHSAVPTQVIQSSTSSLSGFRSGQQHSSTPLTTTSAQRELRILNRLQEEKFVPRVELHRWLEDSEKERKGTMMDRKTLTRVLQKLQREGRCKCILLHMPGLTNCGRSRTSEVVLLPSLEIEPELLTEIHDRIRKYDMNCRGQGLSKVKTATDSVPVLTGVKRMPSSRMVKRGSPSAIETEAEKGRTLQANGFIPAKMVRVRMLHYFLWSYVSGDSDASDHELPRAVESRGHAAVEASSFKVFGLATAIKAMPLELFLQVVGSTKKIENLESYCRQALRLCDLSEEECSALTGSNGSSRLSWLIDVLRRLKLIRLVMGGGTLGHRNEELKRTSRSAPEASLTYAMESQPYIEEPAPQPLSSLSLDAFDLTPRARHEFTITSKESLEAYWQTLEYFFSGAMPTIARRAFPGSNVPELFGLRSWTSLRLMSLEQRTELMKRVEAGGIDRRMLPSECAAIAKDLNLSLEQVLRVSYEKNRRSRLQAQQKGRTEDVGTTDNETTVSRGHRIKPNPNVNSKKRAVASAAISEPPHVKAYKRQRQMQLGSASMETMASLGENDAFHTGDAEDRSHGFQEEEGDEDEEEGRGPDENPINYISVVTNLKPSRSKRFPWSEGLDKILICCYARQRAMLGARYHRVDWAMIPLLPATPAACRRRIYQLKSEPSVRKALMSLCSLLAARYMKHVQLKDAQQNRERRLDLVSGLTQGGLPNSLRDQSNSSSGFTQLTQCGHSGLESGQELPWDSFEEASISAAVNEVMRLRSVAKACNSKRVTGLRPISTKWPLQQMTDPVLPGKSRLGTAANDSVGSTEFTLPSSTMSMMPDTFIGQASCSSGASLSLFTNIDPLALSSAVGCIQHAESPDGAQTARSGALASARMMGTAHGCSRFVRLKPRKRRERPALLHDMTSEDLVRQSLGVANAVELVKLVLMTASAATEVPQPVVDALRSCKEADVFTAFNFLQEQELVVVGQDNQPFVLSPKFFHNASASRFPFGTGDEALSTAQWLALHDSALEQDWVPLPTDHLCGQLLHLLGVISEGEVSMAPFLPSDGLGESEDNRNVVIGVKRKMEGGQEVRFVKPRIQRAEAASPGFRRERGFPGIQVCLHRTAKPLPGLLLAAISEGPEGSGEPALPTYESRSTCTEICDDVAVPSSTEESSFFNGTHQGQSEGNDYNVQQGTSDPRPLWEHNYQGEPLVEGLHISSFSAHADTAGPTELMDVSGSGELAECIRHWCLASEETVNMEDNGAPRLQPVFLKAALHEIEKGGEEGLSIAQLSNCLTATGSEVSEELAEAYVCALESFGLAKQVNAYDHVRVVSAVHSSRGCLLIETSKVAGSVRGLALADGDGCTSTKPDDAYSDGSHGGQFDCEISETTHFSGRRGIQGSSVNTLAIVSRHWTGTPTLPHLLNDTSGHRRVLLPFARDRDCDGDGAQTVPLLPWLTAEGGSNTVMLTALSRRVMGIVMLNPGVTEEQLVEQLDVLNPQTARQLLEMLQLDGHVSVRTLLEPKTTSTPRLLQYLIKEESPSISKPSWSKHYYANVLSGSLL